MKDIKRVTFVAVNFAIVLWEIVSLVLRIVHKEQGMLLYFTVQSNLFAMVVCGICGAHAIKNKYLVTLYSWTTYLLAFALLVPLIGASTQKGGYYSMFLVGENFLNHLACPLAMIIMYLTCLPKRVTLDATALAFATILCYGTTMCLLNAFGVVSGPYFFFEVHRFALGTVVLMLITLVVLATLLSLTMYAYKMRKKGTKLAN